MAEKYQNEEHQKPVGKMSPEEMEVFLAKGYTLRLGCLKPNGDPFVIGFCLLSSCKCACHYSMTGSEGYRVLHQQSNINICSYYIFLSLFFTSLTSYSFDTKKPSIKISLNPDLFSPFTLFDN